jgi:diacylglycerol kinase
MPLRRLLKSFSHAIRGLAGVIVREPNARWHVLAVAVVSAAGVWLGISAVEWAIVCLAFGAVIGAEALNTAVERLADRVTAEREDAIRFLKDAAAGGVLAAALGAAGAAAFIFGPRLLRLFPA